MSGKGGSEKPSTESSSIDVADQTSYGAVAVPPDEPSQDQDHAIDVIIKNNIVYIRVLLSKQSSYRWYVHLVAAPLGTIKFFASAGLRLYSLVDFFYNEDYIFYPIVSYIPTWISMPLIGYAVIGDGHMNLLTRGPSTYKMIANWSCWAGSLPAEDAEIVESRARTITRGFIKFCGTVDTFGASLGTFLGTVSLVGYLTDDKTTLLILGALVFVANFFTNFAYRVRKAGDNLMKLLDGKLRWPKFSEWFIIGFATAAFLGICDYGTSHCIRNVLKLLDLYDGDQDTHVGQEEGWEDLIYGITNSTMGFSAISFLLSQCAQMLTQSPARPEQDDGRIVVVRPKELRRNFYHALDERKIHLSCKSWYVMLPAVMRVMGIWFGRLSLPGEMIGNGLLVLNSCIGLIIRLITDNPYAVGPLALTLAFVSSIIYWHFNIPDWQFNPKRMYISNILYVLKKIGIWDTNPDAYARQLKQTLLDAKSNESGESYPLQNLHHDSYNDTYSFSPLLFSPQNPRFHRFDDRLTAEDRQACSPEW